jgi:GNAT superfamily N-acetyltransferase
MKNDAESITYRRAVVQDAEILADLRVRFLNEVYRRREDGEPDRLRDALRKYFARALPDGVFVAWLAERGKRIVGTSGLVLWRIPGRYADGLSGRMGYLLNFYTLPEARKNGICTRLMKMMIEEARDLGVTLLQLHATPDGIRIYRDLGFAEPEFPLLELNLKRGSDLPVMS